MSKQKGITLTSLVITIIVLLILASISIAALSGDNGIINQAGKSKDAVEIDNEKEMVELSSVQSMKLNKLGIIEKSNLKNFLNRNTGEGKTEVYEDEDSYLVEFQESGRVYRVNKDGNVTQEDNSILIGDTTPGVLEGEGTENNPWKIMSIEDLVSFSQQTDGGKNFSNEYVQLGRTLNFKSELSYCDYKTKEYNEYLGITDEVGLLETLTNAKYNGFKPIKGFRGNFDGNGNAIKNLYEHVTSNAGLFINVGNSVIIKKLEITGKIICDGDNAGGITSDNGNIINCISRVNIEASGNNIGGISVGGIIQNCENYGNIKGKNRVAGISGGENAKILNCKNYGTINGEDCVAGILSQANSETINQCINYGNIEGTDRVGGIIGNNAGRIRNCRNSGEITATNGKAGGIVGYEATAHPVINCCNLKKISGTTHGGGILGYAQYTQSEDSKIINCYAIGELQGKKLGGIIGEKNGYGIHYIENCYWPKEFNLGACSNSGSGLTVTDSIEYDKTYMQSQKFVDQLNNYVTAYNAGDQSDKDFIELLEWKLDEELQYPILNVQ